LTSHYARPHRVRHSFPTRRSSDLFRKELSPLPGILCPPVPAAGNLSSSPGPLHPGGNGSQGTHQGRGHPKRVQAAPFGRQPKGRSEEHTSELQSRENLVCRLLLEK